MLPFKNRLKKIKKYFHILMKKMFIFLHATLQAKILLNKMQSLIFTTLHQNRSLLFSMDITIVNLSQQLHRIGQDCWTLGKYATDIICKSFLKWNFTKLVGRDFSLGNYRSCSVKYIRSIYWINLSCDKVLLIIIQSIKMPILFTTD